jgi:cell division protein FtsB
MKIILKRILLLAISVYVVYTLVSQQKLLNTYAKETAEYANQIEQATQNQTELNETLESLNSTNFIEGIARDKLDMYLPNERVYIDITK